MSAAASGEGPGPQAPRQAAAGWGPLPPTPLVAAALDMGARPACRITVRETGDVQADRTFFAALADLVHSSPGRDAVLLTIVTLEGERRRFLWHARVDEAFRRDVAALLLACRLPLRGAPGR